MAHLYRLALTGRHTYILRRNLKKEASMRFSVLMASICFFMVVGFSSPGFSATKCKGEVVKNDGETLVVTLDGKCKLKPGAKVKIKGKSQRSRIEGC